MCIRGVRAPSVDEAEQFLSADIARIGGHVFEVFSIERKTAEIIAAFSGFPLNREHFKDMAANSSNVFEVFSIERKTAESCYDFSYEEQWPVFGR